MTMFQLKPSEVKPEIVACMEVGLVPFLASSPGLAKSALMREIAEEYKLMMIDVRLSQYAPEDLCGLPMKDGAGNSARARYVPFDTFPVEADQIPDGYNGWLLFFDEFNTTSKSVQAASYKIVLDRMVGPNKLHPACFVVAAGNLATDRAIVNPMSTAMQSRLIHYEMKSDFQDFMTHAIKAGFDSRLLAFLEFQPSKLHSFRPDHSDHTFACPRTWEFASKLITGKAIKEVPIARLAGALSDGVAVELHTFLKEFDKLPSYAAIIASPDKHPVPREPSTCYALISMLVEKFDLQTFPKVATFVKRMPTEFQVIYFRNLLRRHPKMRRNEDYIDAMSGITDFLADTTDDLAAA